MATQVDPGRALLERDAPLGDLILDPENPRLSSGIATDEVPSQLQIVRRLWTEMAVDEVAFSIAANGFYPQERLLVVPTTSGTVESGPYVVVEGNRRVAAVLLLVDDAMRTQLKAAELPSITETAKAALATLPVSVYRNRRDLWSYLGFRHINGTRPWDAYSKARYVASVHERYDIPLVEIASRIGDRHATVTRLYRGLKVLEQAEGQAGFDVEDRAKTRFAFSHLYTAVDQGEFQKFLGITGPGSLKPNPVPAKNLGALGQLMTWLYGRKSTGTAPMVQTQAPDLNRLREVVANPRALSALRSGLSLPTAYQVSLGAERRFREALSRANEELITANGTVTTGYEADPDLLRLIDDILANAERIKSEMVRMGEAAPDGSKRRRG